MTNQEQLREAIARLVAAEVGYATHTMDRDHVKVAKAKLSALLDSPQAVEPITRHCGCVITSTAHGIEVAWCTADGNCDYGELVKKVVGGPFALGTQSVAWTSAEDDHEDIHEVYEGLVRQGDPYALDKTVEHVLRKRLAALRTSSKEAEPDDAEEAFCSCQWRHPADGEVSVWPAVLDPYCWVHQQISPPKEAKADDGEEITVFHGGEGVFDHLIRAEEPTIVRVGPDEKCTCKNPVASAGSAMYCGNCGGWSGIALSNTTQEAEPAGRADSAPEHRDPDDGQGQARASAPVEVETVAWEWATKDHPENIAVTRVSPTSGFMGYLPERLAFCRELIYRHSPNDNGGSE